MENPETWRWVWLAAVAVFALGEMALAGTFFLLPFAVGALAACIAAFAGAGLAVQWILFVAVSLVGALSLVPLRRRLDRVDPQDGIGSRRLMGQEAVVVDEVPPGPGSTGVVRVGREDWRAESADRVPLAPGVVVHVVDVRGTSVVVRSGAGPSSSTGGVQ